jgi:hypothetical protein
MFSYLWYSINGCKSVVSVISSHIYVIIENIVSKAMSSFLGARKLEIQF